MYRAAKAAKIPLKGALCLCGGGGGACCTYDLFRDGCILEPIMALIFDAKINVGGGGGLRTKWEKFKVVSLRPWASPSTG